MAVKQTWRGLVTLTILVSGFISAVTGLVIYVVPEGRVSYWVLWDLLGLTKGQWQAIHTLSSYLLLIFAVFHVINNWRSITNYLMKKSGGMNQKKEVFLSVLFSAIIVFSAVLELPPLQWIMDAGEYFKGLWVVSPDYEPPFGHAEELSLAAFCKRMDINVDEALKEFEKNKIVVEDKKQIFSEIAISNNTTPMSLYIFIKHLEQKIDIEEARTWTEAEIEAEFAGKGLGRKTMQQLADQLGLTLEDAVARLKAKEIDVTGESKVKDMLEQYDNLEKATDIIVILLLN